MADYESPPHPNLGFGIRIRYLNGLGDISRDNPARDRNAERQMLEISMSLKDAQPQRIG
ncbi:MAG: hypothetical protein AB1344_05405 [Pseudomonadota bacterium]